MGKAILAAILIAALVSLTGCKQLDRGTIIRKEYDDPDRVFVYAGKVLITVKTSERFLLQVQGKNEDGKEITEQWSVPENVYNAYEIGDFIVRPTE